MLRIVQNTKHIKNLIKNSFGNSFSTITPNNLNNPNNINNINITLPIPQITNSIRKIISYNDALITKIECKKILDSNYVPPLFYYPDLDNKNRIVEKIVKENRNGTNINNMFPLVNLMSSIKYGLILGSFGFLKGMYYEESEQLANIISQGLIESTRFAIFGSIGVGVYNCIGPMAVLIFGSIFGSIFIVAKVIQKRNIMKKYNTN